MTRVKVFSDQERRTMKFAKSYLVNNVCQKQYMGSTMVEEILTKRNC